MAVRDKIFVSYSRKDKELVDEFKTMLAPAVGNGVVGRPWDDTKIPPGAKWRDEIKAALASAKAAVLMVSPSFLDTPFIVNEELPYLLQAAREEGVTIFWFHLSSCLWEQTEIGDYQAAHDVSTPLDRLSKPERQGVLSKACTMLIQAQLQAAQPPRKDSPSQISDIDSGEERSNSCLDACLLLKQALDYALIASSGGGPTTALHRLLGLAQGWAEKGTKLISGCEASLPTELVHALAQVKRSASWLISEYRLGLPEAGDDTSRRDNDHFRDARQQAHYLERKLKFHLDAIPEYAALENSARKWSILGFRDQTDFEAYLYPTLEQLVVNEDPMQRDLFERLIERPDFTPGELAQEAYRNDLVMDSLNALLKKKWAEWTDVTSLGTNAKGRLTGVGVRLLKQTLAQGRPAANITRAGRG